MPYVTRTLSLLGRRLAAFNGVSGVFRSQVRGYHFTSLPDYDMTREEFRAPDGDRLGCYRERQDFRTYYHSVCRRLGVRPEVDGHAVQAMMDAYGDDIDPIDDIHGAVSASSTRTDIKAPIVNRGGQDRDAPSEIRWPSAYAAPVGRVGGLIENTVFACLESEVERNLLFAEEMSSRIEEGEGELTSVLQYYVGRGAPISFQAMNFLLQAKTGRGLSAADMKDRETVEALCHAYLEGILPGVAAEFKIDMERQCLSAVHMQSPHSSLVLKFKRTDGRDGYLGGEVGRPSFTYVNGKLVQNAHEQVVDPAVFQSMNRTRVPVRDLPQTLEQFQALDRKADVHDFDHFDGLPVGAFRADDERAPLDPALSLIDKAEGSRTTFLSDGVPVALVSRPVPDARNLAKVLCFLTGRHPWEALRFGGYFAHDAGMGQSRACEALVIMGADIAGIRPEDLFPALRHVPAFDFSQDMRETLYENFLHCELNEQVEGKVRHQLFSLETAREGLRLIGNAFVTMQVYKDILGEAERRIEQAERQGATDREAEEIRADILSKTLNFERRYEHFWAVATGLLINMHRSFGPDILRDGKGDGGALPLLTATRKILMEKIETLSRKLYKARTEGDGTAQTTVRLSLELAEQALGCLSGIEAELEQKGTG
ncbi:hypothetical protein [Sneathiella chinensis]|uniref:Uncharacterized protein n=1 Tax=Sneathiella chinensis TaxID=349750 RepID=A0ABQ5U636_9PROT|nr:hypothetical protein [Sneathiella chinensis]GLQ07379.1 hypothetical protein GCM10007924_26000 [Sneathiella chinensis]